MKNHEFKVRIWDNKENKYILKNIYFYNIQNLKKYVLNNNRYNIEYYIGLKDSSRKLIYVGDIVKYKLNAPISGDIRHMEGTGIVIKEKQYSGFKLLNSDCLYENITFDELVYGRADLKVIGNIHRKVRKSEDSNITETDSKLSINDFLDKYSNYNFVKMLYENMPVEVVRMDMDYEGK